MSSVMTSVTAGRISVILAAAALFPALANQDRLSRLCYELGKAKARATCTMAFAVDEFSDSWR